ncbi:MAG TPA: carboxypeptidase-like regulatory domain-containing protein [Solirubrobacteraceae bacterium]|nr:carboxypeptidase-like regulatory domain-containing protein [Solirubrobacteraceae bacterium]
MIDVAFRRVRKWVPAFALALVCLVAAGARVRPAGAVGRTCRVPRLAGLTLAAARARAKRAGCTLRVKGAKVESAQTQTVRRRAPSAGGRSTSVTVWINPLCQASAANGPEINEPLVTPGPTELISGFYLAGGPLVLYSSPGCHRRVPPPGQGTVEVIDPTTGAVLASQTSTPGRFVEIPLPAGTYRIRGTFGIATINGRQPTQTLTVEIPPGHTVRQDFILPVP